MLNKQTYWVLLITLWYSLSLQAQNYSADVSLVQQDGQSVTLRATAIADKKKEAADLAARSAFHALLHTGIEGVRNGMPMIAVERNDYDYRFFTELRYLNYIRGEVEDVSDSKIGGKRRVTVQLTILSKSLLADLEHNEMVVSPGWTDTKKAAATAALNPTIVVVPSVKGGGGFEEMRTLVESSPVVGHAVNKLTAEFSRRGYKTRDFLTQLQNAKNTNILRRNTQADATTLLVQNLPGDIVVTLDVEVVTDDRKRSECSLNVKAVEQQTEGSLASATFLSGQYMTTDSLRLADYAVKKIKDDFFADLKKAFEAMIAKGREVYVDMTLAQTVTDWDFDQEAPYGDGNYFKDALDEWLNEHAQQNVYDMGNSTDKYIHIRLNVPLWDMERNRSYKLSNFNSDLKKFLRAQLGEDYGVSVTAMGQRLEVRIE